MRGVWPLLALLMSGCSQGPTVPPGKIVSNNPCTDDMLAELAAPDAIGAVSVWSHDPASASAPVHWARQFPALGTGAETIIAARPALVLTGNLAASGTNAALAAAGIKTVAIGVPATLAESRAQVEIVARAIGAQAQGRHLLARIDAATRQRPSRGQSALIWQGGGFVAGAGTLQDELLARAGFTNASARYHLGQWQLLSLENLVRHPPDVIFTPASAPGDEGRQLSHRLDTLRRLAPKTRIVPFPDRLLFCGGPTIIEAVAALEAA